MGCTSGRFACATRLRGSPLAALLIAASFVLAGLLSLCFAGQFDLWNNRITDQLFRWRHRLCGPQETSPHLIHVVLNDSSQQLLGLPAWDRTALGRTIRVLQNTNVRLIACDVLFRDPRSAEDDALLVQAASGPRPVVFPLVVIPERSPEPQELRFADREPPQVLKGSTVNPGVVQGGDPPAAVALAVPFAGLREAATALGHINVAPDRDGVSRRISLLYRRGDSYVPALPLRALLEYYEVADEDIEVRFGRHILLRQARVRNQLRRDVVIPIDRRGRTIVNFAGPWEASFLSFPVHKVLAAAEDRQAATHLYDLVDDALVVVSDVSTTTRDYGPGIFEAVYPMSGLHVNLMNSVLTGAPLHRQSLLVSASGALALAAAIWLAAALASGTRFPLACLGVYAVFFALQFWLFASRGGVPAMAVPTVGFVFAVCSVSGYRLLLLQKDRAAFLARLTASHKLEALNRELVGQKRQLEIANHKLQEMLIVAGCGRPGSTASPGEAAALQPPDAGPLQSSEAAAALQPPEAAALRVGNPEAFAEIITGSEAMHAVFCAIEAFAATPNPVLITGESGVGKELAARAIHRLSRREGRFVSVNVAGLDDTMFTDTLFGHARGAFTDAQSVRRGLAEEAEGGTLFLDEIGDLAVGSQIKLLRFIEEKEYRPLGSDRLRRSDARIIIATNADLRNKLQEGKFREDLFYRLTHHIDIPPLRERLEDLPLLMEHFVTSACKALGVRKPAIPAELAGLLRSYRFPGNVRELKNMIENAVARNSATLLPLSWFVDYIRAGTSHDVEGLHAPGADSEKPPWAEGFPTLKELERFVVAEALRRSGGNQNAAARLLGLSPSALSRRISKEGIKSSGRPAEAEGER